MIPRNLPSRPKPYRLIMPLAAALATGSVLGQEPTRSYQGKPVAFGQGLAHAVVRTDASDKPIAIGVVFKADALAHLPKPAKGARSDVAYVLPMPRTGPRTVVDHIVINWESTGHPPPNVYDVPHVDFHFYLVSLAAHEKIRFRSDAESAHPSQRAAAELLPQGYATPPGTAVARMGVHAINMASGELHGQPFNATFIYGFYNRQQTFLEPMVSLDYLLSKPSFSTPIARPQTYSRPGSYPGAYSVKYDASRDVYEVMLEDLS